MMLSALVFAVFTIFSIFSNGFNITTLCFGSPALIAFLLVFVTTYKIEVNTHGIAYKHLLGRRKFMDWKDMGFVSGSSMADDLVLYSNDRKTKLDISSLTQDYITILLEILERRPDLFWKRGESRTFRAAKKGLILLAAIMTIPMVTLVIGGHLVRPDQWQTPLGLLMSLGFIGLGLWIPANHARKQTTMLEVSDASLHFKQRGQDFIITPFDIKELKLELSNNNGNTLLNLTFHFPDGRKFEFTNNMKDRIVSTGAVLVWLKLDTSAIQ